MDLVTVKATTRISHGYLDAEGQVVNVTLDEGDTGQLPAEDAKRLHDKGYVLIAAADADKLPTEEQDETPDEGGNSGNTQIEVQ